MCALASTKRTCSLVLFSAYNVTECVLYNVRVYILHFSNRGFEAGTLTLRRNRHKISKALSIGTLYSRYTRALTFENFGAAAQ
jgi:hypothetical protein